MKTSRFSDSQIIAVLKQAEGGSPVKKKGKRPTPADLLTLARTLTTSQPCHPGTFEEVVHAWTRMSPTERKASRLNIQSVDMTYHDAFHFLECATDDISKLRCQGGIVFGGAKITETTDPNNQSYYLVDSVKKFSHGNNKLPIRLVAQKSSAFPPTIPNLVGKDCTIFWHGPIPSLNSVRSNSYRIKALPSQAYQGIVVLEGDLRP